MFSPDMGPLRILVTGREGQIVRSLVERGAARGLAILAIGRPTLDLAAPETVADAIAAVRPDAIVNAAAYTAVDKAESEPDLAMTINGKAAGAVAGAAARLGVPLVHLSTDYVFDGTLDRPYREDDRVGPLGVYGRSKLAGEQAVAAATDNHVILRTAWVYSPFGANFVKTMLRLAGSRAEVGVVADQQGCPTSALDIADALLDVVETLVLHPDDAGLRGVFHLSGQGATHWAAFAEAIFAASAAKGGPNATVKPITTADYPTPAKRPANSRLDCTKLAEVYGVTLPPWSDSMRTCVARLLKEHA